MSAAAALIFASIAARDTADLRPRGAWSMGLLDPLKIALDDGLEVETHPIVSLLLSPNATVRYQARPHVALEAGLSVPTFAMRLARGYLFPTWSSSERRIGWFAVPQIGILATVSSITIRLETAVGIPLSHNDATPLDTYAPLELLFAPALNHWRTRLGVTQDRPILSWLRARIGGDLWIVGPTDPPKSQVTLDAHAGFDLDLGRGFRLAVSAIVYDYDQRRTRIRKDSEGFSHRERVRSIDIFPLMDLILER